MGSDQIVITIHDNGWAVKYYEEGDEKTQVFQQEKDLLSFIKSRLKKDKK